VLVVVAGEWRSAETTRRDRVARWRPKSADIRDSRESVAWGDTANTRFVRAKRVVDEIWLSEEAPLTGAGNVRAACQDAN
jgi:hypothetical protein